MNRGWEDRSMGGLKHWRMGGQKYWRTRRNGGLQHPTFRVGGPWGPWKVGVIYFKNNFFSSRKIHWHLIELWLSKPDIKNPLNPLFSTKKLFGQIHNTQWSQGSVLLVYILMYISLIRLHFYVHLLHPHYKNIIDLTNLCQVAMVN